MAVLLPAMLTAFLACWPATGAVAYVGGTVIDGTGAPPILDAVIVVSGSHIEAIGTPDLVKVPRGARVRHLDGRWVIPGLIDAHTHVERWALSRFVAYGVTSVRDMGGSTDTIFTLRDEASLGSIISPRLYVSGAPIVGASATSPNVTAVNDANATRRAIDQLALANAHQAKIGPTFDRRLLRPLIDEAVTLNLTVAGHLGRMDALTAVRLGVRSLEHMSGVVQTAVANPAPYFDAHRDFQRGRRLEERGWARLDSTVLDRTARALAEAGAAIVPTLVQHESYSRLSDRAYADSRDLAGVPESVQASWDIPNLIRLARLTTGDFATLRQSRRAQDLFLRRFLAAGGLTAAGTDAPGVLLAPGASLHDELELLVRAGLTPERALLLATRDAARLLEADSLGTLTAGSVADFVVLGSDPLDDIKNSRAIELIVIRGGTYVPEDIRAEW